MADDPTTSAAEQVPAEEATIAATPEPAGSAEAPETQEASDSQETKDSPEIPDSPETPDSPQAAAAPEASETPEAPEASEAPAVPVVPPPEPSVATTLEVEPLAAAPAPLARTGEDEDGGGEWELLTQKLRQWLNQGELQSLWAQAKRPVTALATLVAILLVLRVYTAVLGALDSLPLVPGLLELAGVVWLVRYGVPKLLRSSEREQLLAGLNQRWKAFRGKG